jgi:hypothetical protein
MRRAPRKRESEKCVLGRPLRPQRGRATDCNFQHPFAVTKREVGDVFHKAQANAMLSTTMWYGSDGVALSEALKSDATAAAFAARSSVGYPNPSSDYLTGCRTLELTTTARSRCSLDPRALALRLHDFGALIAPTHGEER